MPAILDDGERVGISHIILKTKYNFGTMFLAEYFNAFFFLIISNNRLKEKHGIYV
jgi:hypothetical protein